MGKGLAAFAAGFGTGYMNQTRQNKLDAERQEDRDMVKKDYDAKAQERARLERERNERIEDGKTATVNQGAVEVDGLSTKPVLYENADVAASDLRQYRLMRDAAPAGFGINAKPVDASGGEAGGAEPVERPAPAAPTMKSAISVNGKQYANLDEAQKAAKTFNDGRNQRIVDRLYQQGSTETAINTEAAQIKLLDAKHDQAQRLLREGIEKVSIAARSGNAQAVFDGMNSQGDQKLTGVPTVRKVVRDIPGIGLQATYDYDVTIKGPDGIETKKTVNSHDLSMLAYNSKELMASQQAATKADSEALLRKAHATYYGVAGTAMTTKADATADKVANALERMSPPDRLQANTLDREHAGLYALINKGIADGTLDDKGPQLARLNKKLVALGFERQALYGKYAGDKPVAVQDPLGLRQLNAKPNGNAVAAGQKEIFQQEIPIVEAALKKANERLNTPGFAVRPENAAEVTELRADIARKTSDLAGLHREITNLKLPASAATPAVAPAVKVGGVTPSLNLAKTPPGQGIAVPLVTPAPVAADSPLEALGTRLDLARSAVQAIQSESRPGVAAGEVARAAYATRLLAAQKAAADLQAQYESGAKGSAAYLGKKNPN